MLKRSPAYYHCDLIRDEQGVRLAKRHDALSLRTLREQGRTPGDVLGICVGKFQDSNLSSNC